MIRRPLLEVDGQLLLGFDAVVAYFLKLNPLFLAVFQKHARPIMRAFLFTDLGHVFFTALARCVLSNSTR